MNTNVLNSYMLVVTCSSCRHSKVNKFYTSFFIPEIISPVVWLDHCYWHPEQSPDRPPTVHRGSPSIPPAKILSPPVWSTREKATLDLSSVPVCKGRDKWVWSVDVVSVHVHAVGNSLEGLDLLPGDVTIPTRYQDSSPITIVATNPATNTEMALWLSG